MPECKCGCKSEYFGVSVDHFSSLMHLKAFPKKEQGGDLERCSVAEEPEYSTVECELALRVVGVGAGATRAAATAAKAHLLDRGMKLLRRDAEGRKPAWSASPKTYIMASFGAGHLAPVQLVTGAPADAARLAAATASRARLATDDTAVVEIYCCCEDLGSGGRLRLDSLEICDKEHVHCGTNQPVPCHKRHTQFALITSLRPPVGFQLGVVVGTAEEKRNAPTDAPVFLALALGILQVAKQACAADERAFGSAVVY